jgi:hypothetical protein
MNPIHFFCLLAGAGAGATHAWMLWRASQPSAVGVSWHWTRLVLIAGLLVASAVSGGILPAAAGWGIGYFSTVGFVVAGTRT